MIWEVIKVMKKVKTSIRTSLKMKLCGLGRLSFLQHKESKSLIKSYYYKLKSNLLINQYEREIYFSCLLLKNLALVNREEPLSADYMISELMKNSKAMHSIYGQMLQLYRSGQDKRAYEVISLRIPTKTARNFEMILRKLDKINPAELISYMENFETSICEMRLTRGIKKEDQRSILVTTIATVSMFAMMLNFTIVIVFMSTMDLIEGIF